MIWLIVIGFVWFLTSVVVALCLGRLFREMARHDADMRKTLRTVSTLVSSVDADFDGLDQRVRDLEVVHKWAESPQRARLTDSIN